MISVRFGLHLDGAYTAPPEGRVGHTVLGPLGLLNMLELYLGLAGLPTSQAKRVVQYRACLKQADRPDRFYHASFATDELGTAAELLSWRDQWCLHGWDGRPHAAFGRRLSDMTDLERLAEVSVAEGPGQRLRGVLAMLELRKTPIVDIEIVDPEPAIPHLWRHVLSKLPARYVEITKAPPRNTLLGRLQQRLATESGKDLGARLPWENDGSVQVVRANSLVLAGRWLGKSIQRASGNCLLVAGGHAQLLDDVLCGGDHPRHGFSEQSGFRPSLQVLPLSMALLWNPLDIPGCLEFLTHPLCPVPGYVRRRLAERLADRPGLSRQDVSDAVPDLAERYGDRAQEISRRVDAWLFPNRHSPDEGAPLADVLSRTQQLAAFFRTRLSDGGEEEIAAVGAAHSQCRALEAAIEQLLAQGESRIRPIQLDKLTAQATSNGSGNPKLLAELGCAMSTEEPGAVVRPVEQVFWWQLRAPAMPRAWPWTRTELTALRSAGVALPDTRDRLQQVALEWLRPILAAQQRLTLVLPPEGEEIHPIWQILGAHIEGLEAETLESILTRSDKALALRKVERRPLPQRKRWWRLPKGVIPVTHGDHSSFSGLNLYLNNPYHWVLKYPARFRPSAFLSIPDDFLLFGNLAHHLVERLFSNSDALRWSKAKLDSWLKGNLESLIVAEGAILKAPGRRVELEAFQRKTTVAVHRLLEHLQKAQVQSVVAEYQLSGSFSGGALTGSADLLVTNHLGEAAIVDLKWGGREKYRAKLEENSHLQLMIYSKMLEQQDKKWPRLAYFILSDATLLSHDAAFFPDARVCSPGELKTLPQLWRQFEKMVEWRRRQLTAGNCEVVLESLEADEDSAPPQDAFLVEIQHEGYNDYLRLAGWEA